MQITFDQVSHMYGKGTPFERLALQNISLTIPSGAFVGIIGQTGSGKSTLIQHLNGLLTPTSGKITIGDVVITPSQRIPHARRKDIGLVFQYPEHQLFEETVAKDVCFGPLNFELPPNMAEARAREALEIVGLDYETMKDRSPFQLSGGQMRRVAIAGVLAMQPKVLVLDEPTAGLDPAGRKAILEGIHRIHREQKLTTLLVTHSMEEAARYADLMLVMAGGELVMQGRPEEVFQQAELLRTLSLDVPETVSFISRINQSLPDKESLPTTLYREEELIAHLLERLSAPKEC
ncbi:MULTISPECIES: energy-coupling factor transporter ATPase [Brevibacillus]|uniref:Energy-coupling factor transporter ATP-binding protein EcfA2 n=1 Tax=Brevibacillus invocatus TaxID=173959 RepID=A0A3M8C4Z7_9BACL|nr:MULTISPECIES: energy-coupling factor transporter ATPase [Brevibacillus]MCM3080906.1 energy-coupling factor transporter ATPase [Brevibacillus invocatus]MCM3431093.1 energy-coupling factor transporter ATPase [Brevibacillus invocatus]MDH4618873.1 energy-coupling factor transporter ATPase [Brevibacillus sp. AY1]RNB70724.1 energy-coupling factor transporter ATPase [Brevibacillus invocatus]